MGGMRAVVLALLVGIIFAFFSERLKSRLSRIFERRPRLVLIFPAVFGALFYLLASASGAHGLPLAGMVFLYTMAPTLCLFAQGAGAAKTPSALDFAALLLLWLPLEAAAGAQFVPRPAQGFLHSAAYGIAIILALVLFTGFRPFPGLKFNLPRGGRDYLLPLVGFLVTAPVLMVLGVWLGFIPWFHAAVRPDPLWMAERFALIFAGTALPEELLFRSLIQNFLMLRFGATNRMLLLAAVIFGCAHLDNGPQPVPNWRYAILAAIAGYGYGKVFQKSQTMLSSAGFHATVDAVKHFFF